MVWRDLAKWRSWSFEWPVEAECRLVGPADLLKKRLFFNNYDSWVAHACTNLVHFCARQFQ
jgi:hypothetical protein